MAKIRRVGVPLKDFTGVKPCYGIKTGFNEAFLIDDATKKRIVQADPKSAEIIKPYLRGQDVKRWCSEWQSLWMIFARRGLDIDAYPAVKAHLSNYREQLEPRPRDWDSTKSGDWKGRKPGSYEWYELQDSIDYWQLFEKPKIIYQEINTLPSYSLDSSGYFSNNKVFLLPTADLFVLGCLNSPVGWWIAHRLFPKMIGGAVTPRGDLMIDFPIAPPTDAIRAEVEPLVSRLIELTKTTQEAYGEVLNWLATLHSIDKPGQKLENFASLDATAFVQEVTKRRPNGAGLRPPALKEIRQVYSDYAPAIQSRRAQAFQLEQRLSNLVNQAYQLTPEEIDLMWKTAPPRMPISRPQTTGN